MKENQYTDRRYFLSDLYRYYFGVCSSYAGLLQDEEIPPRFKALIRQYILPRVSPETTLESHLYYLSPESPEYAVFTGLDARVRMTAPRLHRTLTGKQEILYKESIVTAAELASVPPAEKERLSFRLSELQIPRRKLREFTM